MADNLKTIKQALETDGVYTGLTKGNSMEPLIHHQQDNIIVVRPNGRLKKYDVAVYITKRGKYIMHRVVKVRPLFCFCNKAVHKIKRILNKQR